MTLRTQVSPFALVGDTLADRPIPDGVPQGYTFLDASTHILYELVISALNVHAWVQIVDGSSSTHQGRVWYVDAATNPATANGNALNPFQTITEALAVAGNGDQIVIAPGVYNENLLVSQNGITLSADRESELVGAITCTGSGQYEITNFVMVGHVTVTGDNALLVLNNTFVDVPTPGSLQNGIAILGANSSVLLNDSQVDSSTSGGMPVSSDQLLSGLEIVNGSQLTAAAGVQSIHLNHGVNDGQITDSKIVGKIFDNGTGGNVIITRCEIDISAPETAFLRGAAGVNFKLFDCHLVGSGKLIENGGAVTYDVLTTDSPLTVDPAATTQGTGRVRSYSVSPNINVSGGSAVLTELFELNVFTANGVGATFDVDLPPSNTIPQKTRAVLKNYARTGVMRVVPNGADTIDGLANVSIDTANHQTACEIELNGTDWVVCSP